MLVAVASCPSGYTKYGKAHNYLDTGHPARLLLTGGEMTRRKTTPTGVDFAPTGIGPHIFLFHHSYIPYVQGDLILP